MQYYDKPNTIGSYYNLFLMMAMMLITGTAIGLWIGYGLGAKSVGKTGSSGTAPLQRSVSVQSQCTYKWWWQTPRFVVLPTDSSGISV